MKMKMQFGLCLALAAAFAVTPLGSAWAADAKGAKEAKEEKGAKEAAKDTKDAKEAKGAKEAKEDEEKTGPTEAEMAKARKLKKPIYMKSAEALKSAEMCGQPLVAFLLIEDNPRGFPISQFIEKKLMGMKQFKDDFAKKNLVLLKLKAKRDGKDPKKINTRQMKEPDRKIFENFGLDEKAVARAKRDGKDEPKFDDASNYPAVVVISPDGTRLLFRMPSYDKEGGFGVWLTTVVDMMRTAQFEPEVSKAIEKILENPTEPKKWK
jgi:hypothetical protein